MHCFKVKIKSLVICKIISFNNLVHRSKLFLKLINKSLHDGLKPNI